MFIRTSRLLGFIVLASACLYLIPGVSGRAAADEGVKPEVIKAVKHATVFVRVEAPNMSGSGSGFVFKVDGNSALIVTNHHVVEPNVEEVVPGQLIPTQPRARRRPAPGVPARPQTPDFIYQPPHIVLSRIKDAKVTVVFDSGLKEQRTAKAEVLAVDTERDLAVLRVTDVKNLPAPIEIVKQLELVETQMVYSFGFPFGTKLATGNDTPAITIGKATVSSLRQNAKGELARVQIDGSLNPGNSGGPIVDSQGRLVGVAVATIRGSTGIGLAIPYNEVRALLRGRISGTPQVTVLPASMGKVPVSISVGLIDPVNKIKSVTLYYLPLGDANRDEKALKSLASVKGCKKIELKIEKQNAVGEIQVEEGAGQKDFLFQAVASNGTDEPETAAIVRQRINPAAKSGVASVGHPQPGEPVKDGQTQVMGGVNNPRFSDEAPKGGLLIGIEVGIHNLGPNYDAIRAFRPIYLTGTEESKGKQYGTNLSHVVTLKARPGYAVAGIIAKAGGTMDGMLVVFMRVTPEGKLDPKDSYRSDWVGGKGGGPETLLGGDGTPVIGIVGKANGQECTGLGLYLKH